MIVKTFTVIPESYFVRMVVTVNTHVPAGAEARPQLAVTVFGFQDPAGLKEGSSRVAARAWSSSTFRNGEVVETDVNGVLEWPRFEPQIQWTGFEHPYLLVGFAPHVGAGDRVEKHTRGSKGDDGLPVGFMRTSTAPDGERSTTDDHPRPAQHPATSVVVPLP
jgi:hypothetical protein